MNGPKESQHRMIVQRIEEINEWSKREWKKNDSPKERGNKWMVQTRVKKEW